MSGSSSPKLDTRPVPLFVQGILTGVAMALAAVSVIVYFIDYSDDKDCTGSTGLLVVTAVLAVAVAAWSFIPLSREEALARHRRAIRRAQPTPAALHLVVPVRNHRQARVRPQGGAAS